MRTGRATLHRIELPKDSYRLPSHTCATCGQPTAGRYGYGEGPLHDRCRRWRGRLFVLPPNRGEGCLVCVLPVQNDNDPAGNRVAA